MNSPVLITRKKERIKKNKKIISSFIFLFINKKIADPINNAIELCRK
jgi:hypothetical protein